MNFLLALTVVVGVLAGMSYTYKVGYEHGVESVEKVTIEMEVINNGCWVPSIKWEGEA